MGDVNWAAVGMAPFARPDRNRTIGALMDDYEASAAFGELRPHTQRNYRSSLERLRLVFGAVTAHEWEPAWGQHYLAQRSGAPAGANLDIAVLSIVFSAAVRAGVLSRNPCREVRRHPAPPCSRYVTDGEIAAFRRFCSARGNAYVDLKLSTGARQGQIVALRWSDWDGEALFVAAAKGGRDTHYTDRGVRTALTRCARAFHGATLGTVERKRRIIVTRSGRGYRTAKQMISSLWHPAMRRYLASDPDAARFREHDLRAKVASDSGDLALAQERLGHQTSTITQRVYRRAPRRVESASAHLQRQPDLFVETGLFDEPTTGGPTALRRPAKSPSPPARAPARRRETRQGRAPAGGGQ